MFSSFEEVAQRADQIDKVYEPNTDLSQMYMDMFGLYEQTYQSLLSSFDELAKIQSKHGL